MSNLILPNSKIENVEMVIFDKDGTLIDVHYYWCSMIGFRSEFIVNSLHVKNKQSIYDELSSNMGIDLESKKMKPEGPVGIKPRTFIIDVVFEIIKKYDKSYKKVKVEEIFSKVDEYSKTKFNEIIKVLPDVIRVLKELKDANIKISVATTDLTKRAVLAIKALELEKYFDEIVGADLVKNAKPSPELVEYILKKNKLLKDNVVIIGDSMSDLSMAENAKCEFIGVKSGLCTKKFIDKSKNVINDLSQLQIENEVLN